MKRWLLWASAQPEIVWMAVLACVLLFGCASAGTQAKRGGIVVNYGDRVMDCSDLSVDAGDLALYDVCMDDVDVRHGLRAPAQDGGAE